MSQPARPRGGNPDSQAPFLASRVAIVGYGRFGRALAQMTQDAGLGTFAYDSAAEVPAALAAASPGQLASMATDVVLAVPTAETKQALMSL